MKTSIFFSKMILKNVRKISMVKAIMLAAVFCLMIGCSDQQEDVTPQRPPSGSISELITILANGLQVQESDINYDAAEELFVIDGDMLISKKDLKADLAGTPSAPGGRIQQRRSLGIVSQEVIASVKVRIPATIPVQWASAVRLAMDKWNSVNGTKLNFVEVTSGEHIIIQMKDLESGVIGNAQLPSGSLPGKVINFNPAYNNLLITQRLDAAAHELGHTIGLVHTDGTDGAYIPTTPLSDDKSVMYSYNHDFVGFTEGDIRAIQVLYPYPKEELYIVHKNSLYAVDNSTGKWEALGLPNWLGDVAMTACQGRIFAIQDFSLWRTEPDNYNLAMTNLGGGWYNNSVMTSLGNYIYTVKGSELWRIDINGYGAHIVDGWQGTKAIATSDGYLVVAIAGHLMLANPGNGDFVSSLGNGWEGIEAMTAMNGYIYFASGGELWKKDLSNGPFVSLGPGWNGTVAMTNYDGFIYAVQGGRLWRADPNTGAYVSLGGGWDEVKAMTALQE